MMSLEVVRTRHHIRRFIGRYLVMKIKPNTVQTLGTTENMERRKNMAKSESTSSDFNIKFFSKSEKVHDGGQTWHIFCLSQRSSKLHHLISLSVKLKKGSYLC